MDSKEEQLNILAQRSSLLDCYRNKLVAFIRRVIALEKEVKELKQENESLKSQIPTYAN